MRSTPTFPPPRCRNIDTAGTGYSAPMSTRPCPKCKGPASRLEGAAGLALTMANANTYAWAFRCSKCGNIWYVPKSAATDGEEPKEQD